MKITLNTPTVYSEIYIGNSVIEERLPILLQGQTNFVLTDENVYSLYQDFFTRWFSGVEIFVLPSGEGCKNFASLQAVLEKMLKSGLKRNSKLFAVGGGVVGDLGGLCAALYMRGIACVQIPTTLLAMVDSSVGGKTAVDVGGVKNAIGAFHQPETVLIDTAFLKTLPPREWKCGIGEIVKTAALDGELFDRLQSVDGNISMDGIEGWIESCVRYKAAVVQRDEKESGERKCLNLGHTTAHAIELFYGLSHGEAVLWGMKIETLLAVSLGVCEKEYGNRLVALVDNALKTAPFAKPNFSVLGQALKTAVMDKKNVDERVVIIAPKSQGKWTELSFSLDEYEKGVLSIVL